MKGIKAFYPNWGPFVLETIIDKERLKEEQLKQKLLEENELKNELKNEDNQKSEKEENDDKDLLLKVNQSIEDMKETLPQSLEINNVDNLVENKIENKIENNINKNTNIENLEDTLKISSEEINNPLEIIDINNIDDKEQEISLDIEVF